MYWKIGKTVRGWLIYNYFGFSEKQIVPKPFYHPFLKEIIFPSPYELVVKAIIVLNEDDFYKFYNKEQPLKIRKLLE